MNTITILGAGVAGLAVATELTARGAPVQVVDPAGPPGAHACSWWAGGMLAPFCEAESAEEPVQRLGQLAKDWWAKRTKVTERGTLVVAQTRDLPDLRRFARLTSSHENIQDVAELEPDLIGFSKGLHFPNEAHLDPRQALADLTKGLRDQDTAFLADAPEAPGQIIDCRGFAARDTLSALRGVKGEMVVLRATDVNLSRPIRLLHPRIPLYIVPRADNVFMLGATMIESEDRNRVTARSLLELLSAAYALNPAFGEAEVLEIGTDLRPAFPDNLPRVYRRENRVFANGLYRHGYLLAPALAQAVADLVLENKSSELVHEDCA